MKKSNDLVWMPVLRFTKLYLDCSIVFATSKYCFPIALYSALSINELLPDLFNLFSGNIEDTVFLNGGNGESIHLNVLRYGIQENVTLPSVISDSMIITKSVKINSNWDEKSLSFPKGSMLEPFVNEDGLLDIRMSSDQTQPKSERPFKNDPDFDIFTDEEMKQAQALLGNPQTFVEFRGVPVSGEKFAFLKKLKLVMNPPSTLIGRRIAGFGC